jgi:hypothetical protein
MASRVDTPSGLPEQINLDMAPERDVQRGRKRWRREELVVVAANKSTSRDSATLRGRRRHRSTSVIATMSSRSSRNTSGNFRDTSASRSPIPRKCLLWVVQVERRRARSPSRSRSPNTRTARRHETRSRDRTYQVDSLPLAVDLNNLKSELQRSGIAALEPNGCELAE